MESSIFKQAADFIRNKKNARRWLILFLCLAVAVGVGTYAALKKSGKAMTKKSRELVCSYEVHKHTDKCYSKVDGKKKLVCGYADYVVHSHNDDCYDEDGELVCQLPEIKEHKHSSSCYDTERVLTCGKEESKGHKHTDSCYDVKSVLVCEKEETEGHTHTDSCYDEEGNLTCKKEETEGHTHDKSCYKEEKELTCKKEETEGHTHDKSCYSEEKVVTCGELELHTHTDSCYDKDGKLICDTPQLEEHMHTSDCFKIVEAGEEESQKDAQEGKEEAQKEEQEKDGEEKDGEDNLITYSSSDPATEEDKEADNKASENENAGEGTAAEDKSAESAKLQKVYEDEDVRVTAEYSEEAQIPDEAELRVKKVTAASDLNRYEKRKEEALLAMGTNKANNMCVYNIGFFVEKEEVEPAAPVSVTVQIMEDGFAVGDPVTVVHFGKNGPEVIGDTVVDESGSATFTSDEFSDFVFIKDGNGTSTISSGNKSANLKDFVERVEIRDKDENVIPSEGGTLYVGEEYKITLEFKEKGPQSLQFDTENGTLTYQIPAAFHVEIQKDVPLKVKVGDDIVKIGTYSIDDSGKMTITLFNEGKRLLERLSDVAIVFEMTATAQALDGGTDGSVQFDDAGGNFTFQVTDQPRVAVKKYGQYAENPEKTGGTLKYKVETTVKHGDVHNAVIKDVLTPPQTSALEIEEVNEDNVKVTLKKADSENEITLKEGEDYELVLVPDPENPGKKTFQVKMLEGSMYTPLKEDDVLIVTYDYSVDYVEGSTEVFWGNVLNEVTVTGSMPVENPDQPGETTDIPFKEERGSNVEIKVTPPGDGIIWKTQEFSEATHTLHYTLYTVVPAGEWTPFYIQDDMVVEFGGKRYNLLEFNKDHRVKNLTVSAVDVEDYWNDNTDDLTKIDDLKEKARELKGYNIGRWDNAPADYVPGSVENYIYLWLDNNLEIVFGDWESGNTISGSWDYPKDRLIITEYDLDMSDDLGKLKLLDISDYKTEIEKSASEVLLAGIRNIVNMRFSGYFPGYEVFFNNAEKMNKTGKLDKNTNTIDYTVTLNTTDTTVNKYFQEVTADWMAYASDKYHWGDMPQAYKESMQAVFYDELPDGWEYVEGSLTATACDNWSGESSYPYDTDGKLKNHELVTQEGDKKVIRAPLMFFYNNENANRPNLFDQFGDSLVQLTFTYKLQATDEWLKDHAYIEEPTEIHNHAEIKDKDSKPWEANEDISYFPARLTKTAEQVGETNQLRFTLQVNPNGIQLKQEDQTTAQSYLIVTDKSENLQIDRNTIKVTGAADGSALEQVNVPENFEKKEWNENEWGMLPAEKGAFKLVVPNGKALTVTYEALIPEKGENVQVSNEAGIEGVARSNTGYKNSLKVSDISGEGSGSEHELTVEKQDADDTSKKLEGAEFKFYIVRSEKSELDSTDKVQIGKEEYDCYTEEGWKFTTNKSGQYKLAKDKNWLLYPGNYYILEETKAPAGYAKMEEPILFYYGFENEIDLENYPGATFALPDGTLTVDNAIKGFSLPKTGGIGTRIFYVTGVVLILAAGIVLAIRKRAGRGKGKPAE